jgi:hypothetical protein
VKSAYRVKLKLHRPRVVVQSKLTFARFQVRIWWPRQPRVSVLEESFRSLDQMVFRRVVMAALRHGPMAVEDVLNLLLLRGFESSWDAVAPMLEKAADFRTNRHPEIRFVNDHQITLTPWHVAKDTRGLVNLSEAERALSPWVQHDLQAKRWWLRQVEYNTKMLAQLEILEPNDAIRAEIKQQLDLQRRTAQVAFGAQVLLDGLVYFEHNDAGRLEKRIRSGKFVSRLPSGMEIVCDLGREWWRHDVILKTLPILRQVAISNPEDLGPVGRFILDAFGGPSQRPV